MRLNAGEIAGVAGVDGNGQVELVEVLAGARSATSGSVRVHGSANGSSMAVIPQDRDLDGLILDMRLWENFLLAEPVRARMTRRGWLDVQRAMDLCREALNAFRVRAAGPDALASSLSGGNRQRFEVARADAESPSHRGAQRNSRTRSLRDRRGASHSAGVCGRRRRGASHLQRSR